MKHRNERNQETLTAGHATYESDSIMPKQAYKRLVE